MKKWFALVGVAAIAMHAASHGLSAAGKRVSASAVFLDSEGYRILSDGNGPYLDGGPDCDIAYVQGNFFFLRTVNVGVVDETCIPDPARAITLDFGDPNAVRTPDGTDPCLVAPDPSTEQTGTLDICGLNAVADVRVIAQDLFGNPALVSGTRASLAISLQPDFQGTSAFFLEFEQNVGVAGDATSRTMTAGAGSIAELYKSTKVGKKTVDVSLGRFSMPFSLTVTKQ
jgi:hypothetical protein